MICFALAVLSFICYDLETLAIIILEIVLKAAR